MKIFTVRSLLFTLFFALTALVQAEDLGAVRARMAQRLPQLDTLKEQGALGENNRGFVEVRGNAGDAGAVAEAENKDREAVYAALAEKTKTSAEEVGRARAHQIAQSSRSGVWIQGADGSWKKK
jgi:hypothetical protein